MWADRREDNEALRKIEPNLRSVSLAAAAGYQIAHSPSAAEWLVNWKQAVGTVELKKLLAEQGAEAEYATLLDD